ncbi:MAG: hypothetical protein CVU62_02875 [Deltaproteobacteria bacterium HGW-Deltaproteobacteria-2]|jgi:hypothetical protein|nr:MAG: hypothetical protein CVU62_02875 [Deltaproteobacteria bacterium HGW-Deltaproteobacteria-2]
MIKATRVKFFQPLWLLFSLILLCCLIACGGSADTADTGGGTTTTNAASLDLLVSSPTLNSGVTTQTVTLTALAKDSNNNTLSDQTVSFSATSGAVTVVSNTTDASGQATATLGTGGDKTNRTITITATCGSITTTTTVNVIGTTIEISGQDTVGSGAQATYTITLKDSAGVGIPSKTVTVASSHGNNLSASSFITNDSGVGTITLTGTISGADTLTATGLGTVGQKELTVSSATQNLAFTTPAINAEIPISTTTSVSVLYTNGGAPVPSQVVSFITSRGTIGGTATTNGSGIATVNISSTNVGVTTITASVSGGPSASLNVEFVATTPSTMTLQADPSVISTNNGTSTTQRSTLIAIVRDANNNLVKNQTVNFTLTEDPSGGRLEPSTAKTDSNGKATIAYIAGTTASSTNGVKVQAKIGTTITANTTLTVSDIALFISIGAGPTVTKLTDQTYKKNFDVHVTNAAGNNVAGATVTATATSIAYKKGYWVGDTVLGAWVQVLTLTSPHNESEFSDPALPTNYCLNEDMHYWGDADHTSYLQNGILDAGSDEDYNESTALEPGSVAGVDASVTTDSNGIGTLGVTYLKIYATWVIVRLDVTVTVGGTEGKAHRTFVLTYAVDDYPYPEKAPPDSPFGVSETCLDLE